MIVKTILKNQNKRLAYEKFGYVLMIERTIKNYHGKTDIWLNQWILAAIAHGQLQVFFNEDDFPVGFIAWAFLEKDVQLRLIDNPNSLLHMSEWTEGIEPWIIDCVALPGFYKSIIKSAAQTCFKDYPQVGYVRRRLNSNRITLGRMNNKFYVEAAAYESL